jgi:predicted nucleotidyltransferase
VLHGLRAEGAFFAGLEQRIDALRDVPTHSSGNKRRGAYNHLMRGLREALEADDRIAYALVFGSQARGKASEGSDLDVAIGLANRASLSPLELGGLVSRLEQVTAPQTVDLVLLEEASVGLAYRVFRDGRPVFVRDRGAFVERKVRIPEHRDH